MASDEHEDGGRNKKIKLSIPEVVNRDAVAEDLSAHARVNSLENFKLKQVLSENTVSKSVFIEGIFEPSDDPAVLLLEKLPLTKDTIDKLLNNADLALNLNSNLKPDSNVTHYASYPKVDRGDMKATIIYPATPKHIEKYTFQPNFIIYETAKIYNSIVLPYILSQKLSIQWVFNILEHKSEVDRIIFEDPDPEIGFILLPDLKWDESEPDSIYLIAICHARDIKSLRDLTSSHLPLLNNIKTKGLDAISKKFNIGPERLRIYLHYQPSYYHLHVHFTGVQKLTPGCQLGKAHLLDSVIQNIELCDSYYQKITLPYSLRQNDPLFSKLKEASVIVT